MKADVEIQNALQVLDASSPEGHYLWNDIEIFCSPAKLKFMEKVRQSGLSNLSSDEWNSLMFSVVYTIGDKRSFDYLLPIFLKGVFSGRLEIVHFESDQLGSKLDYVDYQKWPKLKYNAAQKLLEAYKLKEAEI